MHKRVVATEKECTPWPNATGLRVLWAFASSAVAAINAMRLLPCRSAVRVEAGERDDVWGRDTGFTFKDGTVWWDPIIPPGASVSAASDFSLKFPLKIISVNNGQAPGPGCSRPN